ncbi:MAG: hypothetical protein GX971_11460 [Firmicutes bacterium]|nr:hypothetical protein [Bacillota bacterium]
MRRTPTGKYGTFSPVWVTTIYFLNTFFAIATAPPIAAPAATNGAAATIAAPAAVEPIKVAYRSCSEQVLLHNIH